MRLSEQIGSTNITELSDSQLLEAATKWRDVALELEELLLRADEALKQYSNVVLHPSARKVVAKRDKAVDTLELERAILSKQVEMYSRTAVHWKNRYDQLREKHK